MIRGNADEWVLRGVQQGEVPDNRLELMNLERDWIKAQLMEAHQATVYLYAHIHLPYVRHINGKAIANTGSVGLPFDGLPQASYLLVEGNKKRYRISIERVPFDTEHVAKQYKESGYPNADMMIEVILNGYTCT